MGGRALRDVHPAGRVLILTALLIAALAAHLFGQGPGSSAHADEGHGPAVGAAAAVAPPASGEHAGHNWVDGADDEAVPAVADGHADRHDDGCGDARPAGSGSPAVAAPPVATAAGAAASARDLSPAAPCSVLGRAPDGVRMLGVQRT